MARYSIIVSKTGEVLETKERKWADVKKHVDELNRVGKGVFARKERALTPEQKAATQVYTERKDEARETWGITEINKVMLEALKEFVAVFVEKERGKHNTPYDNAYLSAVRIIAKAEGK